MRRQSKEVLSSKLVLLFVSFGMFSKIDHIFVHKASLHKHKEVNLTPYILLGHNRKKARTQSKNKNPNPKEKSPKNPTQNQSKKLQKIFKYMDTE
jgi:hypothetical protein